MRVELRMAPGQQRSGSLTLTNESGGKVRIRTELLDFSIDAAQTPQFERNLPQEEPYSCRSWLTVNPMETELEGKQLSIRYSVRVPEGTGEGSYHCAAGFTALLPLQQAPAVGIQTAVRAVAAIYVVIGDPPIVGETKQVALEPVPANVHPAAATFQAKSSKAVEPPPSRWNAVVVLQNRGRMHFRPVGQLDVLDANDRVVQSYEFTQLPVLPQREQRFVFPLTGQLPATPYRLRARVDIGTGEIQEAIALITSQPVTK